MFIKSVSSWQRRPDSSSGGDGRAGASSRLGRAPPEDQVAQVIRGETGREIEEVFMEVDWDPLGSASIAQAHSARLRDGRAVVVKVRRPGLREQVERDLAIARWLARTAERRTAWGPNTRSPHSSMSSQTSSTVSWIFMSRLVTRRSRAAIARQPRIVAPQIIDSLTSERMLVMERLPGVPLSTAMSGIEPARGRLLADALCISQVQAMLKGEIHGDPHPGNVLVLESGDLGLIDFGIAGRLDTFERAWCFRCWSPSSCSSLRCCTKPWS